MTKENSLEKASDRKHVKAESKGGSKANGSKANGSKANGSKMKIRKIIIIILSCNPEGVTPAEEWS